MGFCSRWKFPTQGMTVLSGTEVPLSTVIPRVGNFSVPLSTVIPWVGNFHLEKNTILDSFSCTTTPQIWFLSRFCVIFFGALSLGEMQFYHPGKKCGNFCLVCKNKHFNKTVKAPPHSSPFATVVLWFYPVSSWYIPVRVNQGA